MHSIAELQLDTHAENAEHKHAYSPEADKRHVQQLQQAQEAVTTLQTQMTSTLHALKDVADLTKYYSRSLHLGHLRVTKPFLARFSLPSDSCTELSALSEVWGVQHVRHLDTITVRSSILHACQPEDDATSTTAP